MENAEEAQKRKVGLGAVAVPLRHSTVGQAELPLQVDSVTADPEIELGDAGEVGHPVTSGQGKTPFNISYFTIATYATATGWH